MGDCDCTDQLQHCAPCWLQQIAEFADDDQIVAQEGLDEYRLRLETCCCRGWLWLSRSRASRYDGSAAEIRNSTKQKKDRSGRERS
jgi:hypothetical protein